MSGDTRALVDGVFPGFDNLADLMFEDRMRARLTLLHDQLEEDKLVTWPEDQRDWRPDVEWLLDLADMLLGPELCPWCGENHLADEHERATNEPVHHEVNLDPRG